MNTHRMLGKSKQGRVCKYGCCYEYYGQFVNKVFWRKKMRAQDKRSWQKEQWE